MSKSISLQEFRKKVSDLIYEEVQKITKEEVNPYLSKIKDKDKFIAWVMRQYFDPTKHASKPWFDSSVNEENVLDYLSNLDSNFPLTPKELADLWYLKNYFHSLDNSKLGEPAQQKKQPKFGHTEETLETLAKKFGVTKQFIGLVINTASDKIKKLTSGAPPWEMDEEDLEELNRFILNVRRKIAQKFANLLVKSNGDIEVFYQKLLDEHLLTPKFVENVSNEETDGYQILSDKSREEIVEILLTDIENDDNLFKLFQIAISKSVFR